MFTPEMIQAAQRLMSQMTPEQMAQMASAIDPSMLPAGMPRPTAAQMREASEKIKEMSSEDLQSAVGQAQQHIGFSAQRLKDEGNALFKNGLFQDALAKYTAATTASDVSSDLKLQLSGNICFCHVKLANWKKAIKFADLLLASDPHSLKALFRRGLAFRNLGKKQAAVADLLKAAALAPDDHAVAQELAAAQALPDADVQSEDEDVQDEDEEELQSKSGEIAGIAEGMPSGLPDARTMASMASLVENLPEEFFESFAGGAGQTGAASLSGKRIKCLARLVMKTLKIWVVVTDVAKQMLQRRVLLVTSVSAVAVAVLLKYYL